VYVLVGVIYMHVCMCVSSVYACVSMCMDVCTCVSSVYACVYVC